MDLKKSVIDSPGENQIVVFSPVSGLAAALSCQSLETPRRRLSLDTNSSSGTPIDTPDRLALIVEAVTPDSSGLLETSLHDSPAAALVNKRDVHDENACMESSKFGTNSVPLGPTMFSNGKQSVRFLTVPFTITSFQSSRSSSGASSGSDGLKTPGVLISPALSPVFDEDSSDSGYGGDGPTTAVQFESVSNQDLFVHPQSKVIRSQTWTNLKTMDDGFDITEDGEMFPEVMHVDEKLDTPPGHLEPEAFLLRKQIFFQPESNKEQSTASESYDGTPLKRKQSSSSRLTRCAVERPSKFVRSELPSKRSVDSNENDDSENDATPLDTLRGPVGFKRRKSFVENRFTSMRAPLKSLNRSHSEADAFFTLHKDDTCHLIGDHSRAHALPVMDRPHVNDLKCISPDTLRRLMNGEFSEVVNGYTLVDCRYPYEYEGGHIKGAINVYTQEELASHMLTEAATSQAETSLAQSKRQIYIFYCEFSRERGPRMTRFLRKCDRQQNVQQYPKLFYPEIYLLDGGYKNFYSACKDLCEPESYQPMHDENHVNDLRKFRNKSKSWCSYGDDVNMTGARRPGLNRGLFNSKS